MLLNIPSFGYKRVLFSGVTGVTERFKTLRHTASMGLLYNEPEAVMLEGCEKNKESS